MGFLDNAGLDYFFGKVKQALGLKMDAAVYDPQGRGVDVFGYVDDLPVRRLVGTQEQPIDIDTLTQPGTYYLEGAFAGAMDGPIKGVLLPVVLGYPLYVVEEKSSGSPLQYALLPLDAAIMARAFAEGAWTETFTISFIPTTRTVTLPAAFWVNNSQTVAVNGVTAQSAVTPAPAPESWAAAGEAGVYCSGQGADSLSFTCAKVPTVDLTYSVLIQEVY